MRSLFRTLPLALCLALPVLAEDGGKTDPPKKPPTKDSEEAKKAIAEGVKMVEAKSYNFKAKLDVEMGGNPMFNTEVKGTHHNPYSKVQLEMMGQAMEVYTDGKSTVQKNPQTGAWEKTDQNMMAMFDAKMIEGMIKSASWEEKSTKVGSHECRVVKAKIDKDKIAKMIAKGGGMGGKISKASGRFYLDKKDGRIRRWKLTMSMAMEAGGQQGGNGMAVDVTSDLRFTYTSKAKVELPDEVKKLLESKTETPKKDGEEKEPAKDKKDKEPATDKDGDEDEGSDK